MGRLPLSPADVFGKVHQRAELRGVHLHEQQGDLQLTRSLAQLQLALLAVQERQLRVPTQLRQRQLQREVEQVPLGDGRQNQPVVRLRGAWLAALGPNGPPRLTQQLGLRHQPSLAPYLQREVERLGLGGGRYQRSW